MSFVSFLFPAFIITCLIVGGVASFFKGMIILIDDHGWKAKTLGVVMIIIPINLLIASLMLAAYNENHKNEQPQVEVNR